MHEALRGNGPSSTVPMHRYRGVNGRRLAKRFCAFSETNITNTFVNERTGWTTRPSSRSGHYLVWGPGQPWPTPPPHTLIRKMVVHEIY